MWCQFSYKGYRDDARYVYIGMQSMKRIILTLTKCIHRYLDKVFWVAQNDFWNMTIVREQMWWYLKIVIDVFSSWCCWFCIFYFCQLSTSTDLCGTIRRKPCTCWQNMNLKFITHCNSSESGFWGEERTNTNALSRVHVMKLHGVSPNSPVVRYNVWYFNIKRSKETEGNIQ